jgi:hypothetical protein
MVWLGIVAVSLVHPPMPRAHILWLGITCGFPCSPTHASCTHFVAWHNMRFPLFTHPCLVHTPPLPGRQEREALLEKLSTAQQDTAERARLRAMYETQLKELDAKVRLIKSKERRVSGVWGGGGGSEAPVGGE